MIKKLAQRHPLRQLSVLVANYELFYSSCEGRKVRRGCDCCSSSTPPGIGSKSLDFFYCSPFCSQLDSVRHINGVSHRRSGSCIRCRSCPGGLLGLFAHQRPTSRGHAHHPKFCASFCASKVIFSVLASKKRPVWTAQMPVLD